MVLEAAAKTDTGAVVDIGKREYREIGLDLDGYQRSGSWEIKEIVDLSLQPGKTVTERFVRELPEGTNSADVEVKVAMWPDPKTELIIRKVVKHLSFGQ